MTASPASSDTDQVGGQLSPPVLDALAGQLDTRARQRRAEQEAARARGGPCSRCGCIESWLGRGKGGWHHDQHGPVCQPCHDTLAAGALGSDTEARAKAARLVLGQAPAPARAGHGSEPAARYWMDEYLAAAFRWWHETPGAPPGQGLTRFAYTSAEALLAVLYEPTKPQPVVLVAGPVRRCPACGCKGKCWRKGKPRPVEGIVASDGQVHASSRGYMEISWTCWGNDGRCRHVEHTRDYGPS